MKNERFFSLILSIIQIVCIFPSTVFAIGLNTNDSTNFYTCVNNAISYLKREQMEWGGWNNSEGNIEDIANLIETVNGHLSNRDLELMLSLAETYIYDENPRNIDQMAKYLQLEVSQDDIIISILTDSQNPDGGFGLAENYASDIIDTKLALKALADLNETEAMTKAALYIASQQNADGGFSYQQGLASNPELTAEIADIFGDCIIKDQLLACVFKI